MDTKKVKNVVTTAVIQQLYIGEPRGATAAVVYTRICAVYRIGQQQLLTLFNFLMYCCHGKRSPTIHSMNCVRRQPTEVVRGLTEGPTGVGCSTAVAGRRVERVLALTIAWSGRWRVGTNKCSTVWFRFGACKRWASLDASSRQKSAGVHGHAFNISSQLLAGMKLRPHWAWSADLTRSQATPPYLHLSFSHLFVRRAIPPFHPDVNSFRCFD